jgi:hypothetical protein
MNGTEMRGWRRAGVAANYIGLAVAATVFAIGEYTAWNPVLAVALAASLLTLVATFWLLYVRTGLWTLTHARTEKLDERELQLAHESFRSSYSIFAAISLSLMLLMTVGVRFSFLALTPRGHYSFGLMAMIVLNYLLNVLPASILAWGRPAE